MKNLLPFHLAMPVNDLDEAREFYGGVLGCDEGRSSDRWIDFNFFGHQFVAHLDEDHYPAHPSNLVDGHVIPVPHYGVVLKWNDWEALHERIMAFGIPFLVPSYIRFEGESGEQGTYFIKDPTGNILEFKSFKQMDQLFAK